MKISFIIVNYQSEKYLQKCISSIKEKVLKADCEIIVVNNDAHNLEAELLEGIKLINMGKNVGYGTACNAGAREARGEILCFLNPDTEIISDNIKELLDEFSNSQNIAIIGPKFINENNSIQEWITGVEITLWDVILNNVGVKRSKKIWESKVSVECAWVSGAAMFIRKILFEELKGFDERFFMYFEDIDLCKRAHNAGYKILYFPDFVIKHFGGKSFKDKKTQKNFFYASQDYYFRKHYKYILALIVKTLRAFHVI